MPILRFPPAKYRLAQSVAAALLVAGVVLIAVIAPSPSAERVAVSVAPPVVAKPTLDGFVLPPALLESREPEYRPPSF